MSSARVLGPSAGVLAPDPPFAQQTDASFETAERPAEARSRAFRGSSTEHDLQGREHGDGDRVPAPNGGGPTPPPPGPAPGRPKPSEGLLQRMGGVAPSPIVPAGNVAGRALVFVVAIMAFLACLAVGSVSLVRSSASSWTAEVSREATIQIKPVGALENARDMERALETALAFALSVEGVADARIVSSVEADALLEPWLGAGFSSDALPVPRLIEITLDAEWVPDFAAMRDGLAIAVPAADLDDHRTWVDRLIAVAHGTVLFGTALLALVLGATALTVVFATRGAMVGNRHIIEVLHFVGAEARFVAREFERHFFLIGIKGASVGCAAAIAVFWSVGVLGGGGTGATGEAMFGRFALSGWGYASIIVVAGLVAVIASATTGFTVRRTLDEMDRARGEGEAG